MEQRIAEGSVPRLCAGFVRSVLDLATLFPRLEFGGNAV